jgi:LmbE family N-acetylglucosaminyl deacetylase
MSLRMISDDFESYIPKRVLAIGAHADDIDFGASGTIAAFAKAGAHIEYLVITDGSKGSADTSITTEKLVQMRQNEQRNAAKVLGAKKVQFLEYEDGQLEITQELKKDIARAIRQIRPDTVIVMDPTMVYLPQLGFVNHPDHRAAGQATLDAVFPLARDHLSFPDLYTKEYLEPHKVAHLLLINLEKQNCFVDITDIFDLKLAGLFEHTSQVPDTKNTTTMLKDRAEKLGKQCGRDYAEGFMRIDLPQ